MSSKSATILLQKEHDNPKPLDHHSLRRRANARNVSFRISLRWPIHIINPVDKTKLSCYTSHRRSTTVSLETYPSITLKRYWFADILQITPQHSDLKHFLIKACRFFQAIILQQYFGLGSTLQTRDLNLQYHCVILRVTYTTDLPNWRKFFKAILLRNTVGCWFLKCR